MWLEKQLNTFSLRVNDELLDEIDNSLAKLMLVPPDEIKTMTLTELIEKTHGFRKDITNHYANTEPVVALLAPEKINKSAISKTYRKL
ncbi:MAG TPA: hypothetical protein PLD88_03570, partial [Candidatus Berkiella sp.]|nr:hypothetical protein [Candidatus Berkiella sp.]